MVTGSLDADSFKAGRPLALGRKAGNTECYHIFPRPPEEIDTGHPDQEVYAAHHALHEIADVFLQDSYVTSICRLLQRLGYAEIAQRLRGANIHQLENVMTLSGAVHNRMDDMDLWFEAVEGQVSFQAVRTASCWLRWCIYSSIVITFDLRPRGRMSAYR